MSKFPMKISIRKIPKDDNVFEILISTPVLRSQFLLPRKMLNELRILIEKVIVKK